MSADIALESIDGFCRDRQLEMMDQPGIPASEHRQALSGLARLNAWTGVAASMYRHIRYLAKRRSMNSISLLDVASGSGDLPIAWAKQAQRDGLNLKITTLDMSDFAVETQASMAHSAGVRLHAMQRDCLREPLPDGFDVITNSLFMHHLDEDDVVTLIRRMKHAAQKRVVVCDLERTRLNLGLVRFGSHVLSRSKIVRNDAALSVKGAFTASELSELARQATDQTVHVKRVFPCRMSFVLDH